MKAIVYTEYGPPEVLHLAEVEKPAPKSNEVLIRIHATSVTIGDVRMRRFDVPRSQWLFARMYLGIRKPKRPVLGMELSGTIESVSRDVTRFKPGDEVFGSTFASDFGGYAEYKCLPEDGLLALKPASMTFEEAAAGLATGGITALLLLRSANIQSGQSVLVYGASGSVGTFAVQLAKHFGAQVTGVCSTTNLDLVISLGADKVIDYTHEDFTRCGETYDVVLDAVGKLAPAQAKRALKKRGTYLNANNSSGKLKPEQLVFLADLVEAGTLRPVIDRCYPLELAVDAHRYVETGHKAGNVVLTID
jgi:NADPH:quinone reductase-like Zn-dependent oxidoreductase